MRHAPRAVRAHPKVVPSSDVGHVDGGRVVAEVDGDLPLDFLRTGCLVDDGARIEVVGTGVSRGNTWGKGERRKGSGGHGDGETESHGVLRSLDRGQATCSSGLSARRNYPDERWPVSTRRSGR